MAIGASQAAALYGAIGDFVRSAKAVGARNRSRLGAAGTPLAVLELLGRGDARPSDIATILHVGPSAVSRTVAPLEEAGLIERVTDPDDARAARLSLTRAGRDRLVALQVSYVEHISTLLSDWSDADVEQAVAMMARLERAILASEPEPETHRRLLDDAIPQLADSVSG